MNAAQVLWSRRLGELIAQRCAVQAGYVAGALATWSTARRNAGAMANPYDGPVDFATVAAELGCARHQAVLASVCRFPRGSSWVSDVLAVSRASGIDEVRLDALLRAVVIQVPL